jgi:EH domain-containing protein 1
MSHIVAKHCSIFHAFSAFQPPTHLKSVEVHHSKPAKSLRGHDDKIRVVLNKVDLPMQHLLRVYGALMWSLGKVIKTPEVLRVYIGSFWDGPLKETDNAKLLQAEQADLLADLRALPRGSTVRKINELVKRARMAKVHAHLLNHIRSKFGMFGKKKDQAKMLEDANLAEIFRTVQQTCNLPQGDFPNMRRFREQCQRYELWKLPKLEKKLLAQMDHVEPPRFGHSSSPLPVYCSFERLKKCFGQFE